MAAMAKVFFIGAGPGGDPELLTVKAARIIKKAPLVIYAGSLLHERLLSGLEAEVINSHGLSLEELLDIMSQAVAKGKNVARLHSGDTAFYSALNEEAAGLRERGIPYEVIPGVSSASLGAARLGLELTMPEVSQTVVFTRLGGKTPGPSLEDLAYFAREDTTLVIFLSVARAREIEAALLKRLPPETPVVVAEKLGYPEERLLKGSLAELGTLVEKAGIRQTALIYVGKALLAAEKPQKTRSKLYGPK